MSDVAANPNEAIAAEKMSGDARLVELKAGRKGPCVFLFPGAGGRIDGFTLLAANLKTDMPVLAIEGRGVSDSGRPDADVIEMAQHYLARIRSAQAEGPYFLVAHSFGGSAAFEIATRLAEAGEKVACLILIDTWISSRSWPFSFYLHYMRVMWQRRYRRLPLDFAQGQSELLRP